MCDKENDVVDVKMFWLNARGQERLAGVEGKRFKWDFEELPLFKFGLLSFFFFLFRVLFPLFISKDLLSLCLTFSHLRYIL